MACFLPVLLLCKIQILQRLHYEKQALHKILQDFKTYFTLGLVEGHWYFVTKIVLT